MILEATLMRLNNVLLIKYLQELGKINPASYNHWIEAENNIEYIKNSLNLK